MNENIIYMENLLRAKKMNNKKEPTLAEKSEFMNAWTNLVKENGYVGRAEELLYSGFSFCGAEPFYLFLKQSSDRNDILEQMFNGKCYGKDSNVTFRLITHLFALMLNDKATVDLLASLIKHFPSACRNKEGKPLGTAVKTIEKYLLNVLSPNVELPSIAEIDLNPKNVNAFMKVILLLIEGVKQLDSLKKAAVSNIIRLEKWAKDYLEVVDAYGERGQNSIQKSSNIILEERVIDNKGSQNSLSHEKTDIHHLDSLPEVLMHAQILVDRILKENLEQKQRITELKIEVQNNNLKQTEISKKFEKQQIFITELDKKKFELEEQHRILQQELNKKEKLLQEKNNEIAERIKMQDALNRDKAKQIDESIQRLASQIKVEYRDFIDALNVPMTVDLGENLRCQLANIFEVLRKFGVKID